eukprot:TRINITY_DN3662_c0_g3_i2.p1 TRINITY_DN3662_c0_g3~~TRINITY_DN3662_c0_g3_i2.p1  ORF type:complete len:250 (+),score=32.32 TRINITY_DN3662_c0_g3_i2:554-1303(+)
MQRAEEATYGQKLQQSIENQLADERRSLEKQRMERLKYKEELERQIEDTNKRRLYKDVMSEYERKINGMDLLAYENLQAELHSGELGLRNHSRAKGHKSLTGRSPPPNSLDQNKHQNNKMAPFAAEETTLPQLAFKHKVHPRFLTTALNNMLDPRVKYMRNNTHNRSYGYDLEPKLETPCENYFSTEAINGSAKENPLKRSGRNQMVNSKHFKSPLHEPKMPVAHHSPVEYNNADRPLRSKSECKRFYT